MLFISVDCLTEFSLISLIECTDCLETEYMLILRFSSSSFSLIISFFIAVESFFNISGRNGYKTRKILN
jgi:hypothetical protein